SPRSAPFRCSSRARGRAAVRRRQPRAAPRGDRLDAVDHAHARHRADGCGPSRAKGFAVRSISVLIPAYNEAEVVRRTYETVSAVMSRLADRYAYEILFTDNHSTDGTDAILREIAVADSRVRAIRFSNHSA